MIHNMVQKLQYKTQALLTSLWSIGPPGWRLALMALLTVGLMAIALSVTSPSEMKAISEGQIFGSLGFWLFLLGGAGVLGVCAGVVETTRFRDLYLTLPRLPWAAFIKLMLSRIIRAIATLTLIAIVSLIAVVVVSFTQLRESREPSSPLTPDLWPTGASPRLIYEPL